MPKPRKHYLKGLGYAGLSVVLASLLLAVWIFTGKLTGQKLGLLKGLPVPVARVGEITLTTRQLAQRASLAGGGQAESSGIAQAFSRLVEEARIASVAKETGVSVTPQELDDEYRRALDSTPGDELRKISLNEQAAKETLIRPGLIRTELNIWFNRQESLNPKAHQTARLLKGRAANGEDFGQLAMLYSEDQSSRAFGGELGFLSLDSVLPELRQELENSKDAGVYLLTSRLGLHVVEVEARQKDDQSGAGSVKLRQIFIKTPGFEQWLAQKTGAIGVKSYIKI